MTEPVPPSDALSGLDGTQLPDPLPTLPDPLAGPEQATWQAALEWQPLELPPLPDASAIREAIVAALGDDLGDTGDSGEAVNQDPPVAAAAQAASQAAEQSTAPQANVRVPPPSATSAGEPAGESAGGESAGGESAGGESAGGESAGGSSPTGGEDRSAPRQPQVAAPIPAAPSQPRRIGRGLRDRPPAAAEARAPVAPADLRRRIRREGVGLPLQTRSDGGATAFLLIALIIIVLLLYFIITGFISSIASLFQ